MAGPDLGHPIETSKPVTRTFQQELRTALLWLSCFTLGCIAFRYFVVEGTYFSYNQPNLFGAQEAIEQGDFARAERTLRKILEREPNLGKAHEWLGYIRLQQDRLEDALAEYTKAAEYQPDDGKIERAIRLINRRLAARE